MGKLGQSPRSFPIRFWRRRKEPAHNLLRLYGQLFRDITGSHSGNHIEIELRMQPGDEVSLVSVRIPVQYSARGADAEPLLTISSVLANEDGRPIEISDLEISGAGMNIYRKLNTVSAEIYTVGVAPADSAVTLKFKAWELTGPLEGAAPYLYATLAAHICLPALRGVPTIVTIVTPRETAPRSTQGNFLLAYPSRTYLDDRYTNIYFQDAADIALRYRCANMANFKMPWQVIGKAAVSAAFVYFITALVPSAQNANLAERLLAVIGAFVASAGTAWDFIQELTTFAIYDRRNNRIGLLVLACQLAVITMMIIALVRLSIKSAAPLLAELPVFALGLAIMLVLLAATGFLMHSIGWWQGFACDFEGCQRQLRLRKGRPECHYTGRVFCDDHIASVCRNCCHGMDLLTGQLNSIAQHRADILPCLSANQASSMALAVKPNPSEARAARPDSTNKEGANEMDLVE